jgi:hypothetical protein
MIRIALVLLLMPIVALATEYRPIVRLQAPTQYESGQPLPLADIEKFTLYCDDKKIAEIKPDGATTAWTPQWGTFKPGTYQCSATATAGGAESARSNTVQYVVVPSKPKAPVIIIVVSP